MKKDEQERDKGAVWKWKITKIGVNKELLKMVWQGGLGNVHFVIW
jgi:hypothetical protein